MIRRIAITCLSLLLCLPGFTQSHGIQYFVSPDGDNKASGLSPSLPFRSIQHALQLAQPGDTIHLAPGHYYQDVYTVRDGEPGRPISVVGTSNAVVHGLSSNRIFQVHHDYISLIRLHDRRLAPQCRAQSHGRLPRKAALRHWL